MDAASLVPDVSTDAFPAAVIHSVLPVVAVFWGPRCGPCRMLAPLMGELALQYADEAAFVKVNVDEEVALTSAFGVRSIPALIFFKAGSPLEMITGLRSAAELRAWIDRHLTA